MNSVYLSILIVGDGLDLEKMATAYALSPTSQLRTGDVYGRMKKVAQSNSWELIIRSENEFDSVGDLIGRFLNHLRSEAEFMTATLNCDKGIGVVIKLGEATGPAFYLSSELLSRICSLGFSLDVDLYRLPTDS